MESMHEEILKEWQRLLKAGRRSFKQHTLEVFLLGAHVCDCCDDGARIVVICYWLLLSFLLHHVERTALRRGHLAHSHIAGLESGLSSPDFARQQFARRCSRCGMHMAKPLQCT